MLYTFKIELSDIDRNVYETLNFKIAQHPSETAPYLLSRVLAFCLSYQPHLEFTPGGLADPDSPALRALGPRGDIELWIEIGNPSARKLHRASKAAAQVAVYTYKNPEVLLKEMRGADIHRAHEIKIFALDPQFLSDLENSLDKSNKWTVLIQQGEITLDRNGASLNSILKICQL